MAKMENRERLFSPFSAQGEQSCEPSKLTTSFSSPSVKKKRAALERSLGDSADPMTPASWQS